jgi:hypothetical protein
MVEKQGRGRGYREKGWKWLISTKEPPEQPRSGFDIRKKVYQ